MSRGHVVGTKQEKAGSQSWYAGIEAETLRQLDAAAAQAPEPTEEAPDGLRD